MGLVSHIADIQAGESNILFKDTCSTDKTSDYSQLIRVNGSSQTMNLTFSNENGYLVSGSGGDYFCGIAIPSIQGSDAIKISLDVKLNGSSAYNQCMIGITDSNLPNSNYDIIRIRGDKQFDYLHNSGNEVWKQQNVSTFVNNWIRIELTKNDTELTGKIYDSLGTELSSTTQTANTYNNPFFFIGINTRNTSDTKYIKNIIVESLVGKKLTPTIEVSHNKGNNPIYVKDNIVLTCYSYIPFGKVCANLQGMSITLRDNGTYKAIRSSSSNGQFTYDIPNISYGTHNYSFIFAGSPYLESVTENLIIDVLHKYVLAFAESTYYLSGDSVTISCSLTEDGVVSSGVALTCIGNNGEEYTSITDSNGVAEFTIDVEDTYTVSYGDVSSSCSVIKVIERKSTKLVYYSDTRKIHLLDSDDNPVVGGTVNHYVSGSLYKTATSDSNGYLKNMYLVNNSTYVFDGTSAYEGFSLTENDVIII